MSCDVCFKGEIMNELILGFMLLGVWMELRNQNNQIIYMLRELTQDQCPHRFIASIDKRCYKCGKVVQI